MDQKLASWSIKSRHSIQMEMLNLYKCLLIPGLPNDAPLCDAVLQMVGASFALWRAAFLSDRAQRSREQAVDKARKFLEAVFSSNIINFVDDRRTIEWSGGFYINNAGYRLYHLHSLQPEITRTPEYRAFIEKWPQFNGAVNDTNLICTVDAWDVTYDALRSAIRQVMAKHGIESESI